MSVLDSTTRGMMVIHQVSGTYLETDNYTAVVNSALQTWNLNPPKQEDGYRGHRWDFEGIVDANEDDFTDFFIACNQKTSDGKKLYLTASANTIKENAAAYPRLQLGYVTGSDPDEKILLQHWVLEPVFGDPDTYVIRPKSFPDYALGILNNASTNDTYVVVNRTWGRGSYHHHWKITQGLNEVRK